MCDSLTRRGEFIREILEKFLPGEVSHGPEEHHGSHEAGVSQDHALVSRELADAVGEHHVVPVILKHEMRKLRRSWSLCAAIYIYVR